jgi:CBS domain containing-hemolysin-like protein
VTLTDVIEAIAGDLPEQGIGGQRGGMMALYSSHLPLEAWIAALQSTC